LFSIHPSKNYNYEIYMSQSNLTMIKFVENGINIYASNWFNIKIYYIINLIIIILYPKYSYFI
jgi:hypothetical protein